MAGLSVSLDRLPDGLLRRLIVSLTWRPSMLLGSAHREVTRHVSPPGGIEAAQSGGVGSVELSEI